MALVATQPASAPVPLPAPAAPGIAAAPAAPDFSGIVSSVFLWKRLCLKSEYVPKIGSGAFKPTRDNILAIQAPPARGKSYAFREYMKDVMRRSPNARILLFSANIAYGTNLTRELERTFGKAAVGFYRTKGIGDLSAFPIVVCSFESLYRVAGQKFDMMLIDEVRTVAGLVGGETMPHFDNVYLLKRLVRDTPCVVVCDADLHFRIDETEPQPLAHEFVQFIGGNKLVVCASMDHQGPEHLRRDVRFLYDCKKAAVGRDQWLDELARALSSYHESVERADAGSALLSSWAHIDSSMWPQRCALHSACRTKLTRATQAIGRSSICRIRTQRGNTWVPSLRQRRSASGSIPRL